MSEETLKPFKVGDISNIQIKKRQTTKKEEEQKLILNFPYLESILSKENGFNEIKEMYTKSYEALQKLDKTKNDPNEIDKVMKAYDRSMELMNELIETKEKLTKSGMSNC